MFFLLRYLELKLWKYIENNLEICETIEHDLKYIHVHVMYFELLRASYHSKGISLYCLMLVFKFFKNLSYCILLRNSLRLAQRSKQTNFRSSYRYDS